MIFGLGDQGFEIAPRHELRHNVELALVLGDVVHRDDARMIAQLTHRLGFPAETNARAFVEPFGFHDRKGDVAIEPRIAREVDALLAALAQESHHFVATGRERDTGGRAGHSGCGKRRGR